MCEPQPCPEEIPGQMKRVVTGNSQHGLIACSDEMTTPVDEGIAVDIVCLNLSTTFDMVSHGILVSHLGCWCTQVKY